MPKAAVARFEMPKELSNKLYEAVSVAKTTGKIRRGVNETTKAIERTSAKFVIIAEDVKPEEIVMHIAAMCDEHKIPYGYVPNKLELGKASGIDVPSSSIAIVEVGDAKAMLNDIGEKVASLRK